MWCTTTSIIECVENLYEDAISNAKIKE
jgi:hypothetical protein